MEIKLTKVEQKQLMVDLYDTVAIKMGVEDIRSVKYDCRFLEVAENVSGHIREAFYERYPDATALAYGAYYLQYGPKVNKTLPDDVVLTKPGFIQYDGHC